VPKEPLGDETKGKGAGQSEEWEQGDERGGSELRKKKTSQRNARSTPSQDKSLRSRRQSQASTLTAISTRKYSASESLHSTTSPSHSRQHKDKVDKGHWDAFKGGVYVQPAAGNAEGERARPNGKGVDAAPEQVASLPRLGLNHVEDMRVLKGSLVGSVDHRAPMRVLQFLTFARHTDEDGRQCIPRSTDQITLLLSEVPDDAKLVFVSHHWLRPWRTQEECEGAGHEWAGHAHPDDDAGTKHKLICDALVKLAKRKGWDSGMKDVYLWIDFAGIEQDNRELLLAGVASLCGYMALCHAVLVPSPALPEAGAPHSIEAIPAAFANRAWTRVETLAMYAVSVLKHMDCPEFWVAAGEGASFLEKFDYIFREPPSTGELFCEEDRSLILGHELTLVSEIEASVVRRGFITRHQAVVNCVAFDPKDDDQQLVYSGGKDGVIKLVNRQTGMALWTIKTLGNVKCMDISPDGNMIAAGVHTSILRVWDVTGASPILIGSMAESSSAVLCVAYSHDGLLLASGSSDGSIRFCHGETLEKEGILVGHKDSVNDVTFSPDGSALASACGDGVVKLWDPAHRKQSSRGKTVNVHEGGAHCVAFSPGNSLLASGGEDGIVFLWNVKEMEERGLLRSHGTRVCSVAFSPDGSALASCGLDCTVRVWNPRSMKELCTLKGHIGSVSCVTFATNSTVLASGGADGTVRAYDPKTLREAEKQPGHACAVTFSDFTPDGSLLVTVSDDSVVKFWDPKRQPLHQQASLNLLSARRRDARILTSESQDFRAKMLSLDRTKLSSESHDSRGKKRAVTNDRVLCVAVSENNTYLAAGTKDCAIKLFNLKSMSEITVLAGHTESNAECLCYEEGEYKENSYCPVRGHTDQVDSLLISSDGTVLVSASSDGTTKVWNLNAVLGLVADESGEDKKPRYTVNTSKLDRRRPFISFSGQHLLAICCSEDSKVLDWPSLREKEMIKGRDGNWEDPRWEARQAAQQARNRVFRDTSTLRWTRHKVGTRGCTCWSKNPNTSLEEFKVDPRCPLMAVSDGTLTATVGNLSVTANEDRIYIHSGPLYEKEVLNDKNAAIFIAPSKVESLACRPPFVFAGCQRGEVLKLEAPILVRAEASPTNITWGE